jgi:hypothetical protein
MAEAQICLSQSVIREEYFEISPEHSSARTLEFPKAKESIVPLTTPATMQGLDHKFDGHKYSP